VLASGALSAQAARPSADDTLAVLLDSVEAQHFRGAFAEAHATLADAESLARRRPDPSALARVWIVRTGVWLSQTTASNTGYAEADSAAARGLHFAERSGQPRLIADAEDHLGRVLYSRRINLDQGDYERPLAHFRRSLTLRKAAGDTQGVVESMFRVGLIHERKDESEQAIAMYEEAMRLAGEAYPLERSNLARHLAYQRQAQGDLDRALELFTQSLALREQAGFVLTRPSALVSIGDLHRRRGEYDMALQYGRRGLEEAERLNASRFVVGALISLGQTQGAAGDRAAALKLLERADSMAAGIGYVSGVERARAEKERLGAPVGSPHSPP
jgi:tetratricopeptide (TPR) repeat protein